MGDSRKKQKEVKYNIDKFSIYKGERGDKFPNIIFDYELKDNYGSIEEGKDLFYYFGVEKDGKKIYLYRRDKSINYYYYDKSKKKMIKVFTLFDEEIFKKNKEEKAEYIFNILKSKKINV